MANTPITSVVKRLLEREGSPFADRFHAGLEIQIQPFSEAILGRAGLGGWPIRIPKNAGTSPIDNDSPWPYYFAPDGVWLIGWTGWNWRGLRSEFFVIDLDSCLGHKAGLAADELEAARQAACSLPYVTVRRSKSGNGYHAYVTFANPPHTANHDQHTRLAKAVLQKMSAEAGFDFSEAADVVGGNAWFFERTIPRELRI
jgi:hypothetical protein